MEERSIESNDINSPIHHIHLIRSWLNRFDKTKLEYYSIIFGIFGLSFLAFNICILILIFTTYEYDLTDIINCSILNITYTHVKLCESYRCRIFNDCIPYVCTIIFVRYDVKNISYESKLFSSNNNLNSSCSYEPISCLSRSRIKFEQITFLQKFTLNLSQCCLHSITQQPMICHNYLNSKHYFLSILLINLGFFISLILISLGILTQLHLNNYFKSSHKDEENVLNTILNFHLSNGTIPVNYDILTQTISHHNTPSNNYQ